MPPIPDVVASLVGPFGTSLGTFQNIGCTATLTSTGPWLVIVKASHYNNSGLGPITGASEMEVRHQSTRFGAERWCSLFGSVAPSVAAGSSIKTFFVVSATSGDTVSLWLRSVDTGSGLQPVEAGDASVECIFLGWATPGVDYVYAEGPNSDAAEVIAAGATWITGSAAGRIGQGAGEVPYTVPANGDYWMIGYMESFLSGAVGPSEINGARIQLNGAPAGTGVEHHTSNDVTIPTAYEPNFFEEDVFTFTAGAQPEIQWECNNAPTGLAVAIRRTRIFLFRLGAVTNYAFIVNGGNIQVPASSTVLAANALTFNFGSGVRVLISGTATFQTGGGNWGRAWLNQDAGNIRWPLSGRIEAFFDEGTTAFEDECPIHFGTVITQTGSVTWRLGEETDPGANLYTLGRTPGNLGPARTVLVAIHLDQGAVAPPIVLTPAADSMVFDDLAAAISSVSILSAPLDSMVFDDLPPTTSQALIRVAAVDSMIFDDLPPMISVAIVQTPATDSVVFDDLPPTTSQAIVRVAAVDSMIFDDLLPTASPGVSIVTAPLDNFIFDDLDATVTQGFIESPAPDQMVFTSLDPTSGAGVTIVTAPLSVLVFADLAPTIVGPTPPPPPPQPRPVPRRRGGGGGGGNGYPFIPISFQPPMPPLPPQLREDPPRCETPQDDAPSEAALALAELFSREPRKAVALGLARVFLPCRKPER